MSYTQIGITMKLKIIKKKRCDVLTVVLWLKDSKNKFIFLIIVNYRYTFYSNLIMLDPNQILSQGPNLDK